MKDIIEYLKERVTEMNKSAIPMDYAVVIDGEEAQKIIDFYERHKDENEQLNEPGITPCWDKIPEQFQWVAIDEDGDECAYTTKPSYVDDIMWGNAEYVFTGRKLNMKGIDWTKTLSKRPEKA